MLIKIFDNFNRNILFHKLYHQINNKLKLIVGSILTSITVSAIDGIDICPDKVNRIKNHGVLKTLLTEAQEMDNINSLSFAGRNCKSCIVHVIANSDEDPLTGDKIDAVNEFSGGLGYTIRKMHYWVSVVIVLMLTIIMPGTYVMQEIWISFLLDLALQEMTR